MTDPTPEEIRKRCEEIQKTWNPLTLLRRSFYKKHLVPVETKLVKLDRELRRVVDDHNRSDK